MGSEANPPADVAGSIVPELISQFSMSMSKREEQEMTQIGCQFWRHINDRNWDDARALLSDDFEAYWPQSREKIVGPDNFIAINPASHAADWLIYELPARGSGQSPG